MGLMVSILLTFEFCVENMRDKLEATQSEIFDVVPFQESRQLGIAEPPEYSGLGCAQPPRPRSLPNNSIKEQCVEGLVMSWWQLVSTRAIKSGGIQWGWSKRIDVSASSVAQKKEMKKKLF